MQEDKSIKNLQKESATKIAEDINSDNTIYQSHLHNNMIFAIVSKNILEEDFKRTRRAGIALFLVPLTVNIGFIISKRNQYLKHLLSFSSLVGCYSYFNSCVRNESLQFVKKDSTYSNLVRQNLNTIESLRMDSVDQSELIQDIVDTRRRVKGEI